MNRYTAFDIVQTELSSVETEIASVIHSRVDWVNDISCHLLRAGGKRLRPALYLLCARGGCYDTAAVLPGAVAVELIHMATLVHDDIIDNAATRRGLPTANARWGNNVTVLSGDYLFAKAFSLIASKSDAGALKILTDTICEICEGEIEQVKYTFDPNQTEADYFSRIGKKTAGFIAASCELGALSASMSSSDVKALRQYGYALGMAFQITDDILDITASSAQIGKPAGNDLRQGVLTLPVIYSLSHSSRRHELRELILSQNFSDAKLEQGMTIIRDTDAIEYSYTRVGEYLTAARNALPVALSTDVRTALLEIADFVGLRKY